MFLGEYQHTIDAKGRLAIPAKFRGRLERGAVLVRGVDPCLSVFPLETWEAKGAELDSATLTPQQRRLIEHRYFKLATECELDAQGRIVVPPALRRFADLAGEVAVVGARHRFEIWNAARWRATVDALANEDLSGLDLPF